ncbi:amidase domain-containing protein [Bacillaceae bacterium S4-13-56]
MNLQTFWERQCQLFLKKSRDGELLDFLERKRRVFENRGYQMVRMQAYGKPVGRYRDESDNQKITYDLHLSWLVRKKDHWYMEEKKMLRTAVYKGDQWTEDRELSNPLNRDEEGNTNWQPSDVMEVRNPELSYTYDRRKAVQYAERWWNDYNPKYKKFDVDCTNFVSQCLHEGGAPMWGQPDRTKGWWMSDNSWSYSWSVANALRWYLSGSTKGFQAEEVSSAEELRPGDIICYDFEGDGKWNHNTIVVEKDANGEPLVNAHTQNSRHRYWSYEDSTAYTLNIQYKFFHIKG